MTFFSAYFWTVFSTFSRCFDLRGTLHGRPCGSERRKRSPPSGRKFASGSGMDSLVWMCTWPFEILNILIQRVLMIPLSSGVTSQVYSRIFAMFSVIHSTMGVRPSFLNARRSTAINSDTVLTILFLRSCEMRLKSWSISSCVWPTSKKFTTTTSNTPVKIRIAR